MQARRKFLATSGVVVSILVISDVLQAVWPLSSGLESPRAANAASIVKIMTQSADRENVQGIPDPTGADVWFDPGYFKDNTRR